MMITHRIDIDLIISPVSFNLRVLGCYQFSHQVLEIKVKYYIARIISKSRELYKKEHQVHVSDTKKGRCWSKLGMR